MSYRIGLVGGRGYTGAQLLSLLGTHPSMELGFASSSSQAGQPLTTVCPGWPDPQMSFCALQPEGVSAMCVDAWVLAVPNGVAGVWAGAIRNAHQGALILDLSADHRFDTGWTYGLPELYRDQIRHSHQVANPGCYATGVQLALQPVQDQLSGTPVIFAVSGFSGAGRTPGDRNNPQRLRDNLIPYSLSGHGHEREISAQLGREVRFMPHVAAFFRGISLTIAATLVAPAEAQTLFETYNAAYRDEARVQISREIPQISAVRETPDIHIGGFSVDARDPRRVTMVATLDNLLKGAASQAIANLNLALGLDEHEGIEGTQLTEYRA